MAAPSAAGGLFVVGGNGVDDLAVGFDGFFVDARVIQGAEQLDRVGNDREEFWENTVLCTVGNPDMECLIPFEVVFSGADQFFDFFAEPAQFGHVLFVRLTGG